MYRNQKQKATIRANQISTGMARKVSFASAVKLEFREPMGVPPVYTRQIP